MWGATCNFGFWGASVSEPYKGPKDPYLHSLFYTRTLLLETEKNSNLKAVSDLNWEKIVRPTTENSC